MFGIGWAELMVIGLVALLVVGPEKLPEMARTIGKIYRQLRQAAAEAGQTISAEVELINSEASKVMDGLEKDLPRAVIGHPSLEEIKEAVKPQPLFFEDQTAAAPSETGSPAGNQPADREPSPAEATKNA